MTFEKIGQFTLWILVLGSPFCLAQESNINNINNSTTPSPDPATTTPRTSSTTTTTFPGLTTSTPGINFTTPFNVSVTGTPNVTESPMPDLNCPAPSSQCSSTAVWLCNYVQWKIDFIGLFIPAFRKYRDQILTADDIPPTFSSCPLLYVNCVNTDQSRYFYKGYCGVYYCADGLYRNPYGSSFRQWVEDQNYWRDVYRMWKRVLVPSNRSCT